MSSDIKSKTINGFKWGVLDNLSNSGVTFLVGLVLANILSPSEFGVIGIITIFINLSVTIIDGGFSTALIRRKNVDDKDYNTMFYSNLGMSLFLMLLLMFSSRPIALFFDEPILEQTLTVMSVVLLINALTIVQKAKMIKMLDFKSQAISSLFASVVSGTVGILMAMNGYGVWALVGQQVSRQTLLMLGFWYIGKWRPLLLFSMESFKEMFGFGAKHLLATLINSIFKDAFLAVIGKVYSTRDLAYYNRAEQFNTIFSNNFGQIVLKVSLPSLSKIQDEDERLKLTFRKFVLYVAIISFAAVFTLAAVAKPLFGILLDEEWLPSVPLLQIISLYAAIYPLNMLNLNILNLRRRSDYFLKLEVVKKVLFIPVVVIGCYNELEIMLWTAVAYYYLEYFLNGWYSERLVGYGTGKQVKDLSIIFTVSALISIVVWTLTFLPLPDVMIFIMQIVLTLLLHISIYTLIKHPEFLEIKEYCLNNVFKYGKQGK